MGKAAMANRDIPTKQNHGVGVRMEVLKES